MKTYLKTLAKRKLLTYTLFLLSGMLFYGTTTQAQSCCNSNCPSVVKNGNFSGTLHQDYETDMEFPPNGINSWNQMMEGTDASSVNTAWQGQDHTGDGGKFLIIDGPTAGQGNAKVWKQYVVVEAGKEYCFSAFVRNIDTGHSNNRPTLNLIANGGTVATAHNINYSDGWIEICGTFTAPNDACIEIAIEILGKGSIGGNDAGIDDISFKATDCDCCDEFEFNVNVGCTGDARIAFTGDYQGCKVAYISVQGFDYQNVYPTHIEAFYSLCPGESRDLYAYLIGTNGDTLCKKLATVHCPLNIICCDGLVLSQSPSLAAPGLIDVNLHQNPCIPCPVYAVKVNGTITADGLGAPLMLPLPWLQGLPITTVDPWIEPILDIEYLDQSYQTMCSEVMYLGYNYPTAFAKTTSTTSYESNDQELLSADKMKLYPNPAQSTTTLEFDLTGATHVSIEVMDITGKTILLQQNMDAIGGINQTQINTEDLKPGVYMLFIRTATESISKQLVIQK